MTLKQAIQEFISALELTEDERSEASRQHTNLRDGLAAELDLDPNYNTFLTGSYARSTATRPLKDIDVFCVLASTDAHAPDSLTPGVALGIVKDALDASFPGKAADPQNRSVNIAFVGSGIAYDVVPAFHVVGAAGDQEVFLIPDIGAGAWIQSNPRVHKERSVAANEAAGQELKPLTKAVKHWNRRLAEDERVRSFHIEVMAWEVLVAPPASRIDGLIDLFDGLAGRVLSGCPDPAGLGPDIDSDLEYADRTAAATRFRSVAEELRSARALAADGKVEAAHHLLYGLFGAPYPERGKPFEEPPAGVAPVVITSAPDDERSRFG